MENLNLEMGLHTLVTVIDGNYNKGNNQKITASLTKQPLQPPVHLLFPKPVTINVLMFNGYGFSVQWLWLWLFARVPLAGQMTVTIWKQALSFWRRQGWRVHSEDRVEAYNVPSEFIHQISAIRISVSELIISIIAVGRHQRDVPLQINLD